MCTVVRSDNLYSKQNNNNKKFPSESSQFACYVLYFLDSISITFEFLIRWLSFFSVEHCRHSTWLGKFLQNISVMFEIFLNCSFYTLTRIAQLPGIFGYSCTCHWNFRYTCLEWNMKMVSISWQISLVLIGEIDKYLPDI